MDEEETARLDNLEENDSPPAKLSGDSPKYRKKSTRVQVAIAKFYGMGEEDSWEISEIADYLNVSEDSVYDYVHDSDISDEVEDQLAEVEARTRMKVTQDLLDQLETLDGLITEASEEKRPAVVSYDTQKVFGTMDLDYEGMSVETDEGQAVEVPVPDKWKEVTKTDKLEDLWAEKRQVVQKLQTILGLDAPEQVESEHNINVQERKVWGFESDDMPDQTVSVDGEQQRSDDVIDVESSEETDSDSKTET